MNVSVVFYNCDELVFWSKDVTTTWKGCMLRRLITMTEKEQTRSYCFSIPTANPSWIVMLTRCIMAVSTASYQFKERVADEQTAKIGTLRKENLMAWDQKAALRL